ncbi:39S ribosomal protein L41-A [Pyrus ussuriensis x Pyrus communis]|uniref:39S ribosomal protein L41-A n=1 Tax=Pyrus ussuriensis x Pyrus communis TaxID=2448454 RepID=A0A5N5HLP7_9ROSA|nr:39S ribosomal protein L41-A [Pyrus ussuriensis x Pyrus communis]
MSPSNGELRFHGTLKSDLSLLDSKYIISFKVDDAMIQHSFFSLGLDRTRNPASISTKTSKSEPHSSALSPPSAKYVVQHEKLPNYVVPDLTDFKLKPYVSQCPREVKTTQSAEPTK